MIVEKMKISILNEYFQNIPIKNNVKFVKFDEVAVLTSGQDLTSDRYFENEKDGAVPYLTGASNLQNDELIINRFTDSPTSIAIKNDILLTCKGTIGEMHILEYEKVHIARQFMGIRCKNIDLEYLYYYLKMKVPYFLSEGKSIIPGIKRDTLMKLEVPLPELDEQLKIVNKVKLLFAKLDEIEPIENTLNQLKISFPNAIRESILFNYVTGIKESNKIPLNNYNMITLPSDWKWIKFEELTECRMGKTILSKELKKEGIPVYSATNNDSVFGYIDKSDLILHEGDIVIPARGNSIGCATYINDEMATCTQTTIACYPNNNINSKFLYYCCYAFKKVWFKYTGSAIPQITISNINKNYVPLPPMEEQKRIVEKIEQILPIIDSINFMN